MYLAGAAVLTSQLRRADDPVVRRQLTWLRNGAVVGIVPFAADLRGALLDGRGS